MTAPGPYTSERDAYRAVLRRDGCSITEDNHRLLCGTLAAAGVDTGAYEHRVLMWLAGFEPSTVAVVARWVARAHRAPASAPQAGPVLDEDQVTVILAALDDAAGGIRERAAYCGECQAHPADLCDETADQLRRAEAYDALAGLLGAAKVDSEAWTCAGCGGQMIGHRPADDRCRECRPGGQP